MKIAVCGISAPGCLCAALLAENGYDVTLICSDVKTALELDKNGINVSEDVAKRKNYRVNVALSADNGVKYDVCFIAVNAYDTLPAVNKMVQHLSDEGVFVSLQSGMTDESIIELVGGERVISCMMSWQAEAKTPGNIDLTVEGDFYVGRMNGVVDDKVKEVCRMMNCIFPAAITDNIIGHKFTKLIMKSSTASVGALCGLTPSSALQLKQARRIMVATARESVKVAEAMNIRLENYADRINFYRFLSGNGFLDDIRRYISIRFAVLKFKRVTSSDLGLLRRNEPTEVDHLNGYIVSCGENCGVATPLNARIVEMVHEAETRKRKLMMENLYDDAFINLK